MKDKINVKPYTLEEIHNWLSKQCLEDDATCDPASRALLNVCVHENWDVFNVPGRTFGYMVGTLHTLTMKDTTPCY